MCAPSQSRRFRRTSATRRPSRSRRGCGRDGSPLQPNRSQHASVRRRDRTARLLLLVRDVHRLRRSAWKSAAGEHMGSDHGSTLSRAWMWELRRRRAGGVRGTRVA
jgi:hypothetical protein